APARDQIAGIGRWLVMELNRLGVALRLGTAADAQVVLDEQPGIVVLATGGRPNLHERPAWGAAEGLVVSTWDILTGRAAPGQNVLIYDAIGQFPGATCADFLATRNSLVELVTPDVRVTEDLGGTTFPVYLKRLYERDVVMTPNTGL